MNTSKYPIVYAAYCKDQEVVKHSSSGGIFTVLSDYFLQGQYAVVCSLFDSSSNTMKFEMFFDTKLRDKARGSKYVQSDMNGIFKKAEAYLNESDQNRLLFIGTGCQARAFQAYMRSKKRNNQIVTVDLICHGVPSPRLFREYLNYLTKEPILHINCRDKRYGWDKPVSVIKTQKEDIILNRAFYYHTATIRPSCNKCPYTTVHRHTDLTIGDFWGIQEKMPDFYNQNGNSLILINSSEGEALFQEICGELNVAESNINDCLQPNLKRPTPKSIERDYFWKDFEKKPISYLIRKYGSRSLWARGRRKLQTIFKTTLP